MVQTATFSPDTVVIYLTGTPLNDFLSNPKSSNEASNTSSLSSISVSFGSYGLLSTVFSSLVFHLPVSCLSHLCPDEPFGTTKEPVVLSI